jgi:hypothetical protein
VFKQKEETAGALGLGSWTGLENTADVIWGNKYDKVEEKQEKKEKNVSTKEKDRQKGKIEVKRLK